MISDPQQYKCVDVNTNHRNQTFDELEKVNSRKNSFYRTNLDLPGHHRNGSNYFNKPPMHSQSQQDDVLNTSHAELLAKLHNSNRNLESTLIKLNAASQELSKKDNELLKSEAEVNAQKRLICEYKEQFKVLKKSNAELKQSTMDEKDEELKKYKMNKIKVQQTSQYNEQLFMDYQNILRLNQQQQSQVLEQSCEIAKMREELVSKDEIIKSQTIILKQNDATIKQNEVAIKNAVKQTENKVTWLEQDLDRIEEKQNQSIPQLTKRLQKAEAQHNSRLDCIESCEDYIVLSFEKSLMTLKKQLSLFSKSTYVTKQVLENHGKKLFFSALADKVDQTNDKRLQALMEKIDLSPLLSQWLENLIVLIIFIVRDSIVYPIAQKLNRLEGKYMNLQNAFNKINNYIVKTRNEKQNQRLQEQQNSSFINQSSYLQSQYGYSQRKTGAFTVTDKENHSQNYKSNITTEDSFDSRLVEFLDVGIKKITDQQQLLENSFIKFQSLLKSPRDIRDDIKNLTEAMNHQFSTSEILSLFLKKELFILKQEITFLSKSKKISKVF